MVSSLALRESQVEPTLRHKNVIETTIPVDDYRQLAQKIDWQAFLKSCCTRPVSDNSLAHLPFKVLDLACGTGRWLQTFLQQVAPQLRLPSQIRYDLLDCCESSLIQAAQKLRFPLISGMQYADQVQFAPLEPDAYDCIWSMHGFYAMPKHDLTGILSKMNAALQPEGRCFIAQATREAFYIDFYERYRAAFGPADSVGFTAAEDVVAALERLGIEYHISVLRYDECIPAADRAAVEHYIMNEATVNSFNRDDTETVEGAVSQTGLDRLLNHPDIKAYLDTLVWDSTFHFPEEVWAISFKKADKGSYPR
ncbi:MAG: class I SAM-dependent methyltransferase [Cyanobacteria bacterium P01_D01_bin.14]